MKTTLRRIGIALFIIVLVGAYILVAGRTGSCSACSAMTSALGL